MNALFEGLASVSVWLFLIAIYVFPLVVAIFLILAIFRIRDAVENIDEKLKEILKSCEERQSKPGKPGVVPPSM